MARRVLWFAIVCSVLAVVATRWPYRSGALFSWDSANYALAVERVDLAAHRPHPPGYLGYVFAARALNRWTGDVNAALVLWNVLGTILAAIVIALFAWEINEPRRRVWATVAAWAVLVTSPLVWVYGEVAEIYVSELLVSLLITYASWRMLRGRPRSFEWCAASIAAAILFKVTAALFLMPLVVYAWIAAPVRGWRRPALLFTAAAAASALVFLIAEPRILQITWSHFVSSTSGSRLVDGTAPSRLLSFNRNIRDTLTASLAALGLVNALALMVWAAIDRKLPPALEWRVVVMWVCPLLLFLVLFHIGKPGYVLPLLPAAALLLGGFYARQHPALAATLIASQAIVNLLYFMALAPFSALATGGPARYRDKTLLQRAASDLQPLTFATAFTIADSDARVAQLLEVAAQCPGGALTIVAGTGPVDWRRVLWYMPAATSIHVDGRGPAFVGRDRDFSPVPTAGLTLRSSCPVLWIAPDETMPSLASGADVVSVPGLGWTTPAGAALHVSPSGITVGRE